MRLLLILLLAAAGPAFAQARITEADARAFFARQELAWNAGQLGRYFAAFTPDARFTDQAYVGKDDPPVPYGTSTLAQARAQAAKALKAGKVREIGRIQRVEIAADGRSARIVSGETSSVESGGRTRYFCATRTQVLVLDKSGLRSRGQTDTFIRCPR